MRINGAETANLNGKSEAQRQIAHRGHRSYCSAAQSYAVMLATRRSTTPATPAHVMHTAHHSNKQNVECNMQCCVCFMLCAPSAHSENVRGLRSHCSDGQ